MKGDILVIEDGVVKVGGSSMATTLGLEELQKENKVLQRALELACQTIKEIMPDKPLYICGQDIADRLGIPMYSEIKDYEWFIKQAQKELEKEQKDEDRN